MNNLGLLNDISLLPVGVYIQLLIRLKFIDDAIIRSNEPEEVLTYTYSPPLNSRFIIPWRKIKGKLRRLSLEKQRSFDIEKDCHLKDNLCLRCPVCFLFGATGETGAAKVSYNILSRVLGETFISTTEVSELMPQTQNAIDEKTQTTGQALMSIVTVPKETEFLGVVTLRDPTPEMASILVDNLERITRLGASTREWGRVETTIIGYRISDREELTAYDHVPPKKPAQGLGKISELGLPDVETSYKNLDLSFKSLLKANKLLK
ncbi:MAG: type I-D CRISPR-associated protein Cas7/Csc2 [Deltaproteobacteria bacterium]|mgnify:CR=1 FL=1|nr:type I-D CRISPR-associated protein Cas7/Csc2 [Deltaproteobacteria bacterium]